MGRSYTVPRNVKGESRILVIFSVKSLVITLAFGAVGIIVYFILKSFIDVSLKWALFIILPPAAIGYGIASLTIPDVPWLGPLQKAGGENLFDILVRLINFKISRKAKLYLYNYERKNEDEKEKNSGVLNVLRREKK